jgi:multiple sugar transport system substrate-binding protein
MNDIHLRGITWDHTRGFVPMIATAQRYRELHPNVHIDWHIRSLQSFADDSIADLSKAFDLLVIDHPSIGEAATAALFLPLDEHIAPEFLADQADNGVGASHQSYGYGSHQWALAIDAATPVAASRPDVLERNGWTTPTGWDEVLELARANLVCFAGLPLDCLMHWYTVCINEGQIPFRCKPGRIVADEVGIAALQAILALVGLCGEQCLRRNPIAAYELMTREDCYGYSPLAYGYTNYARADYGIPPERRLRFDAPVSRNGQALRTTLGGAGLAISARCGGAARHVALAYAQFVASPAIQTGLYCASGGQPGHRNAWLDGRNSRLTRDFFRNTLATHDCAFIRPRHPRAIRFQTAATGIMDAFLHRRMSAVDALAELNRLDEELRTRDEPVS